MKNLDLSLHLVTDRPLSLGRDIEWIVSEAVKGGVSVVQLREKNASSFDFYHIAKSLMLLLKPLNIPLIINDRLDIALAVDADGLHIGQSDLPYHVARKLLGKDKIIGLSVETMDQVIEANKLDVDYIGISPVFSTDTKLDIKTPFGLSGVEEVVRLTKHKTVTIGGINAFNTKEVMHAGADGIAVVSAICSAESPYKAAQELQSIIKDSKIK